MFHVSASAQDVLESIQVNSNQAWPDFSPENLKQADGTLFFASGNVLVLLDADTLAEQSRIAIDAPRGILGLAVDRAENLVYAACGNAGLQVVDISDKSSPFPAANLVEYDGTKRINATALDMDPTSTYLYIADNFFGMHIINISKPMEPEYLTGYAQSSPYSQEGDDQQTSYGGYINISTRSVNDKKLAFILDQYFGLRILDISNINSIQELDSFDMRSDAYFGQLSGVVDVTANDNYVFVADSAFGIGIIDYLSGQEVVINKQAVGQIESPGRALGLALSGNGDRLFLADGSAGLLVADISEPYPDYGTTPDHPEQRVKNESYPATGAYAVIEYNGRVYLANAQNGLVSLEPETGSLDYAETGIFFNSPAAATSLTIEGDYAYVLDNSDAAGGMRIIELKNEDTGRSKMAGFSETPGQSFAVSVHGSFAWIADGTAGVTCVDITDPQAPQLLGGQVFIYPDNARDIKIMEGQNDTVYACIADSADPESGLVIAEADSQGNLSYTSSVSIQGARAVVLYQEPGNADKRYALVAAAGGVAVVDVSNPAAPEKTGFLDTSSSSGSPLDVAVRPPHGVVAHGAGGILLVDLSDPENPKELDSFEAEGTAKAVFIKQSYVHIAVGRRGLLVLGISDTDPATLDSIDVDPREDYQSPYHNTQGYAADVFVTGEESGSHTYIADTHGGFLAFQHSNKVGGGIDEQPFEESSDDTGCFIQVLGMGR